MAKAEDLSLEDQPSLLIGRAGTQCGFGVGQQSGLPEIVTHVWARLDEPEQDCPANPDELHRLCAETQLACRFASVFTVRLSTERTRRKSALMGMATCPPSGARRGLCSVQSTKPQFLTTPNPNADHYQMLAYCVALRVPTAWLVYAGGGDSHLRKIRHTGIEVVEYPLDLRSELRELLEQVDRLAEKARSRSVTRLRDSASAVPISSSHQTHREGDGVTPPVRSRTHVR